MKKLILLSTLLVLASLCANAQENRCFGKGYVGGAGLSAEISVQQDLFSWGVGLETIHGYSFGEGFYVGAGAGANVYMSGLVTVPIFMIGKYSFLNHDVSPFLDVHVGDAPFVYNPTKTGTGNTVFLNPGFGIDTKYVSLRVSYKYGLSHENVLEKSSYTDMYYRNHYISVGLMYNFGKRSIF